jgi:hypothetical protein
MSKQRIMNWVWDHPLTVTVIISIPVFVTVIIVGLKTHII